MRRVEPFARALAWVAPVLVAYGRMPWPRVWRAITGAGLIGHAALWDPFFLLWGLALLALLRLSRGRR